METTITTELLKIREKGLQEFSEVTSEVDSELSVYADDKATPNDVAECYTKLSFAFPNLHRLTDTKEAGFMSVFAEAVQYSGMTKQQLYDATMNCICHKHQYGELQIADIIDFDVKVKLYTYSWAYGKDGFVRTNLKREVGGTWEYWWCKSQDLEKVNRLSDVLNKK